MRKLTEEIIRFFHNQGFVIVSSIDKNGLIHSSCKGIVKIDPQGKIYLLDVYRLRTFRNLEENPNITITAVDEHKFIGYALKGKAQKLPKEHLSEDLMKAWDERITSRLTHRLLKNIHEEKGHARHPEALLPHPEYLIEMEVEEIVDLTPHKLK